ncbi:hypothetical protein, partial [Streptomyces shenzhenensis]|uniref:hypothetical protein n=1 Tax=Streptomyces shenzhenensis TaxID=943815 RepID=UPI0015F1084B
RAAAKTQMKRNMSKPFGLVSLFLVGMAVLFAGLNHDASWLWAIPVWWGGFAAVIGLIALLVGRSLPSEAELVIDRSAITVHVRRNTSGVGTLQTPWRDISHVGVLPPKRGSVNPKLTQVYEGNHLLVVRLRPGVPYHSTRGMRFSDELHELGYRVIATVGSFGADKEQILGALDQFAGDRVLHTEQEFLARDPRIQPKMF